MKDNVYLCEYCKKGQLDMCDYYREHFLEEGTAVRKCPEFEEEMEQEDSFIANE